MEGCDSMKGQVPFNKASNQADQFAYKTQDVVTKEQNGADRGSSAVVCKLCSLVVPTDRWLIAVNRLVQFDI